MRTHLVLELTHESIGAAGIRTGRRVNSPVLVGHDEVVEDSLGRIENRPPVDM